MSQLEIVSENLDTIHHRGLRLALEAFRISTVECQYIAANEPSLYNRRIKLSLQYLTKLKFIHQIPPTTVFSTLYI